MTGKAPPEDLVVYETAGVFDETDVAPWPGFLGFWVESGYTFFFFDRPAPVFESYLAGASGLTLRHVHEMKYSQWQDGAGFKPFRVGPLVIEPPWDPAIRRPGDLPVVVDPGLAFGFGGHFTTKSCLRALVKAYQADRPAEALDLGAGTGVLSVAAARLGASNVTAVEYSHLAADAARNNVRLNDLNDNVRVIRGLAEDHARVSADLVMSNLHDPVQQAVLAAGGFDRRRWAILSGLFHHQAEEMEAALTRRGYTLLDRERDERWTTLLLKRQ